MPRNKLGKVNSQEFWKLHKTWHPKRAPLAVFPIACGFFSKKSCNFFKEKLHFPRKNCGFSRKTMFFEGKTTFFQGKTVFREKKEKWFFKENGGFFKENPVFQGKTLFSQGNLGTNHKTRLPKWAKTLREKESEQWQGKNIPNVHPVPLIQVLGGVLRLRKTGQEIEVKNLRFRN